MGQVLQKLLLGYFIIIIVFIYSGTNFEFVFIVYIQYMHDQCKKKHPNKNSWQQDLHWCFSRKICNCKDLINTMFKSLLT